MKKENIIPQTRNVLAEVTVLPNEVDGFYEKLGISGKTHQAYYLAKALGVGPQAADADQCPGLKEGDNIMFEQIAGYSLPTEDGYCKLVRGHNIIATFKNIDDMAKVENYEPTGERILVEVIGENIIEDGIFDDSKEDPREQVTQKARVVSCADKADQYEVGTIVAFDPYCGNPILNDGKTFLKTVYSHDILYSIAEE